MNGEERAMGAGPATMDEPRSGEVWGSDEGGAPGAGVRSTQVPIARELASPTGGGARSDGLADDAARGINPVKRRPRKKLKGEVVATRFDADGLGLLEAIRQEFGLPNKAAALRRCVETIADILGKHDFRPERLAPKHSRALLAPVDLVAEATAAARDLAAQYSRRSREIYAIGNNLNQIARLANAQGHPPTLEVLAGIESQLALIRRQLNADAKRDQGLAGLLQRIKEV